MITQKKRVGKKEGEARDGEHDAQMGPEEVEMNESHIIGGKNELLEMND